MILATARAACSQEYPRAKYRVVVSDDSGSISLRNAVRGLNADFDNVLYITRATNHEMDFKTGNLNFAVGYTKNLRREPTEFVAQLDADVVPSANWLQTVVRHVLSDERLGMVTAPQVWFLSFCSP